MGLNYACTTAVLFSKIKADFVKEGDKHHPPS